MFLSAVYLISGDVLMTGEVASGTWPGPQNDCSELQFSVWSFGLLVEMPCLIIGATLHSTLKTGVPFSQPLIVFQALFCMLQMTTSLRAFNICIFR